MAEKFYVTTPIYYVNARPHIGHAYTTIVADVLARRHRLLGEDVLFLTGTDEHGQKIERAAAAAGVPPQAYADKVSESFRSLWKRMGITNDRYIRTTDADHKRGVQKLFADLYAKGHIYLSTYTGQYSVGEEMFVEGPPGTIGPDGKPTETVTEENFFFRLGDYQLRLLDLIESDELTITPESRKNEVLSFLRGNVHEFLDNYRKATIQEELNSPDASGSPEVQQEIAPAGRAFTVEGVKILVDRGVFKLTKLGNPYLPGALKDLSVSRSSFTWGIPVPEPAAPEAKGKHVIYVWLDALANYLTAAGYGDDSEEGKATFAKWWPADLHLVGKEIIRFHCVYWPAFLMAAGLPLPKAVTAHGWLLFDDSKMSKSKGNIVRAETILDAFGTLCPEPLTLPSSSDRDLFAADVLRYFLLREIPFGQDGSFSFEAMITRYNADLANGYGNLVSRVLSLVQSSYNGAIPDFPEELKVAASLPLSNLFHDSSLTNNFFLLLKDINALIAAVDGKLTAEAPWKLAKSVLLEDQRKLSASLSAACEAIKTMTAFLYPILPFTTAKVWRQLGLGEIEESAARGELHAARLDEVKFGANLGSLGPIFPRADKGLAKMMSDMEAAKTLAHTTAAADATTDTGTEFKITSLASEVVQMPVEDLPPTDPAAGPRTASLPESNPGSLVAGSAAVSTERPGTPPHTEAQASGIFSGSAPADSSPQITIDDFAKVELRVAKVLVCERIPKADKLLRLEVDLGFERRQILSGIAEWYTPEDLIGRRIVVITNLAPRKMRGLESHGMLLAGSAEGGKPALATFADTDDLPLGARLK